MMLLLPSAVAASRRRVSAAVLAAGLVTVLAAGPGNAEPAAPLREEHADRPDGIHVLDGSYVMDAGLLHVNVTNHGLIGSEYSTTLPYANAPSGQWPGGSGDEYLYGAGLWIGAKVDGEVAVTTGQPQRELRPADDLRATIYESWYGTVTRPYPDDRPRGRRLPPSLADDDRDGRVNEETLNGYDDDGDGLIDEDFGQIGDQMMVCTMHDDLPLVQEIYPMHHPLGVTVVQRTAAWTAPEYSDIMALDYEVTNSSSRSLEEVYLGLYVDCDIQNRGNASTEPDDLAGFYDGAMRDRRNTWHRIQVGWMKDAAPNDPLPGVFGALFLDCDTDFSTLRAPRLARVRTYQRFATDASVAQDGEPLSDEDRYALMSSTRNDPDVRPEKAGDYKFLISCGPFNHVAPGATLHFRVALVIGDGMEDMLANALLASELQRGAYYDMDLNPETGGGGTAETEICLGDLPRNPDGSESLFDYRAAFMDNYCVGSEPRFGYALISHDDMTLRADGRRCIWVNADNCEECFRATGQECTEANDLYWHMASYPGYWWSLTGGDTRVPWISRLSVPPAPPVMRAVPGDNAVDVFWDDASEFENAGTDSLDDFESYRVWRVKDWTRPQGVTEVQGPPLRRWNVIGEWDRIDFVRNTYGTGHMPLGANTGLDVIRYRPVCLDDPRFAGLDAAMREFVDADPENDIRELETVRLADGRPRPGYEILLPWEKTPAVLDTFFAVTPRPADPPAGIVAKRGRRFFTYRDDNVRNGFRVYYAVTAKDRYDNDSKPGIDFALTVPRFDAQTPDERATMGANIYLYPNPVTREALSEFDRQYPTLDSPTGMQVVFANLPQAHNTIRIYTASGDLVQTLEHDGASDAGGSQAWNMMSRNGQEVTSGIYFFVVHSDRPGFEDVVGRFVVVW